MPTMLSRIPFLAVLALALVTAPAARAAENDTAEGAAAEGTAAEGTAAEGAATEAAPAEGAAEEGTEKAAEAAEPPKELKAGASGPREQVHVLARPATRLKGKNEVTLLGTVQFATKFVEHAGIGGEYAYHLTDNFALRGSFVWNLNAKWTSFSEDDLNGGANREPRAGGAVLAQWTGLAGVEFTPVYGKVAVFDWTYAHFGFYLGAGGGVSSTKVQTAFGLDGVDGGRTYGSTGFRPTASLSGGFRVFMGDLFALRLEVRDTIYADQVDTINGCNAAELSNAMAPSPSCRLGDFTDPGDQGRSVAIIKDPSSGVMNNLAFVAGLSVLF